jgi:NADH-quinone oxidoreductase subunit C
MSTAAETLADELRRLLPKPEMPASAPQRDSVVSAGPPVADGAASPAPGSAQPPALAVADRCTVLEHSAKGFQLDVRAPASDVVAVARLLDARGFGVDAVTGVDWIAEKEMEVVYDFFHPLSGLRVAVRARIPREDPAIPTIQGVFPGANWHERETHDFFGIRFEGHPDLSPFLLPEDADYHPLKKDFTA